MHLLRMPSQQAMSDHPTSDSQRSTLILRTERPEDEGLLLSLYASTREEELNLTGWDEATRAAFVRNQFDAMRRGYAESFPHAQFAIVEWNGRAAGRLVLDRLPGEFRIVDMVLLPDCRGRGLGTALVQQVLEEARQKGCVVRLHVFRGPRSASPFYQRLGFSKVAEDGPYDLLEWQQ